MTMTFVCISKVRLKLKSEICNETSLHFTSSELLKCFYINKQNFSWVKTHSYVRLISSFAKTVAFHFFEKVVSKKHYIGITNDFDFAQINF